jgi:biopolymer transport protein ExbD
MKINTQRKRIKETVLISMTDVMFLLIIFLLISSNFNNSKGMQIKLPSAKSQQQANASIINLMYDENYNLYLEDKQVSWNELPLKLSSLYEKKPDFSIFIRADKDIPLQNIIKLMDAVKLAGFQKLYIATKNAQ